MQANLIGISRHRLGVDGTGITTLVAFHGCGLSCRYCLNPGCLNAKGVWMSYSPEELYGEVKKDHLYFVTTGGGITFGGGEPLLHVDFIKEMMHFEHMSGGNSRKGKWKINVETSLNEPEENVYQLLPYVDQWIVDIKDMNDDIYETYTGKNNAQVMLNLRLLACFGSSHEHCKVRIRVPHILNFNTDKDVKKSLRNLKNMGFTNTEEFTYVIR